MAGKRKAGDDIPGARHRAARTDTTAGDDIAGTSAQTAGPTANAAGGGTAGTSQALAGPRANAAGGGTAGTSQALAGPTAATTPSAVGYPSASSGGVRGGGAWSGQSGSAPPHRQALAGHGATIPAFAVGYPGGSSQFGGAAGGGFSQPHPRAPMTPMLQPPLGNPAVGSAPFPYQYHAPTGYDFFPGQNQIQIAGPWQTGTGQPRGDSGRLPACIRCGEPTTWVLGSAPLCGDCYNDYLLANSVLQQNPQMGYAGQQRQLDLRLPRPSSTAPGQQPSSPAPVAVGPRLRAPGAQSCPVCRAPTTRVLGLEPPREDEVCHDYLLASNVLQQHRRMGYVIPGPVHSHASSSSSAAPEQQAPPRRE